MDRYWTGDDKERLLPRSFGNKDCIGLVEVSMSRIEDYGCKGYNSNKGKKIIKTMPHTSFRLFRLG